MTMHNSYTEPLTYWEWSTGYCTDDVSIYSQADGSHIASCDMGTVAPRVHIGALIAAAPELLDGVESALRFVDSLPRRRSVKGRKHVAGIKRTLKAARRAARDRVS